ncbi:hypothetical protein ACHAXT_010342 [Thalassiosira profunda]
MDALFTLQPAARRPTDGLGASVGGGDASAVTDVCFVRDPTSCEQGVASPSRCGRSDGADNSDEGECSDDESSDDDSQPLQFRCSNLLLGPRNRNTADPELRIRHASHLSAASHNFLSGGVLASCHHDGSCKLWDLATRRAFLDDICKEDPRGGAGLAVRRVGGGDAMHRFLYHTRDPLGTVSLHDLDRPHTPVLQMHTHSTSFCAMAPCHCSCNASIGGQANLVALPTEEHSMAAVRDLRCDPEGNPAWRVNIGGDCVCGGVYGSRRKYGMLTSLALCHQDSTRNVVLGCGTESGTVLFYDLGAVGRVRYPWRIEPGAGAHHYECTDNPEVISEDNSMYTCGVALGKDPVLSLDLCSSSNKQSDTADGSKSRPSLVAVGGCAGDADDLSELPEEERGTVATIKVKLADESSDVSSNSAAMRAGIRARTSTCSIASGGKVGVSICRFRPDGRMFAIGGWDHRLRLFGRTSSKPLAVLRGHEESVTAMDWAGNSSLSGLLATGAGDGRICVWRAFPHSTPKALLP